LGPQIRANAVAPGPVLPPPEYDEHQVTAVARRTLLERWGSAEDVTRAVKYLIEADYVTGDVITVDGGERYGHRKSRKGT
jgi:3-oxoacyl-[acyl-carrier protein] reductase/pteridine reductase